MIFLKWFPPAWVQVKSGQKILYLDPAYLRTYFANYPKRIEFSKWPDPIDGLPEELEKAQLILVTHHHKDHCKAVTVNRLRDEDTLVIGPHRCARELGGAMRVVEPGEEVAWEGMRIRAAEAYNTKQGASTRKAHPKGSGVGYVLSLEGKSIYHAGDTDFIPEMRELGNIDVALLPIGGTFTMDAQEAVEAALAIEPKTVIPIHRLKGDPQEFKCRLEARSAIRVIPLEIGETYVLP